MVVFLDYRGPYQVPISPITHRFDHLISLAHSKPTDHCRGWTTCAQIFPVLAADQSGLFIRTFNRCFLRFFGLKATASSEPCIIIPKCDAYPDKQLICCSCA